MELNKKQIEHEIRSYQDRLGKAQAKLNELPRKLKGLKLKQARRALLSEIRHARTLISYATEALAEVEDWWGCFAHADGGKAWKFFGFNNFHFDGVHGRFWLEDSSKYITSIRANPRSIKISKRKGRSLLLDRPRKWLCGTSVVASHDWLNFITMGKNNNIKIISNRNLSLFWTQNFQCLIKQVPDEDNNPKDNCDVEYL